jgi:hypothetical protein
MIMVLLVLKLFVSSQPFELLRCPMHLCFATPWGTSWITLCYVFSMLKTNKWLSMHYYSWSFVCVTFHVVTWLLNSIVRIISFMPCLEYFDLSLQCFALIWSRLCWLHVTSNIIIFVTTYLLEDEQELSLGMLIRYKCIYNFWCSMLVLHQLLYILFTLHGIFMHFLELTY